MKKVLLFTLAVAMIFSIAACTKAPEDGGSAKVNFPTASYLYNTSDTHKAIGEYIQSAFAQVGFDIDMDNQEWNTFVETRKSGDYFLARNGWVADYSDPICFLDMWTSASGNNDIQYGKGAHTDLAMYSVDLTPYGGEKVENGTWAQTYDVLIAAIKACTDETQRYEMMHIAEDMLMDTGCITPIYFYTDLYMLDDSVNGFFSNPLGYKYMMYTDVDGKTDALNVCLASEPATLDPALNSTVDGATMLAHLFSGLAKWTQDDDGNLVVSADAAEELTEGVVNEDGTVTYTYTLREGMKWSNGDELKASDFANSWKRAASEELGADYGYMFEVVKGYPNDLAVEADDAARTIKVTLTNAVSYWNELLAFPTYFPVHASSMNNESWSTDASTFISNGAYTMDSWTHDSVITLKKNPNYIDAASIKMETINCYLSDDSQNMLANFKKGDWLMIDDVPTDEIATLKTEYPTEFVIAGQIGTYYVCWNINADLLPGSSLTGVEKEKAQQEIRKAFGLLLDRNYIVEKISQCGEVPASSFVAMGMTNPDGTEFYKTSGDSEEYVGYYNTAADAFEANCAKAVETLSKYYNMETVA